MAAKTVKKKIAKIASNKIIEPSKYKNINIKTTSNKIYSMFIL